jgi:hypothetical protein
MTSIAAKRAVNAGQSVAIDAGKKLVEKITTTLAASRNQPKNKIKINIDTFGTVCLQIFSQLRH